MKALVFDIDDTLYDQLSPFSQALTRTFGPKLPVSPARLFAARRIRSDEALTMHLAGQLTKEEMYIYRIREAFRDCGIIQPDSLCLEFQQAYAEAQQHITLAPGVSALLDKLADMPLRLALITNGDGPHQRAKIAALGLKRWFPETYWFISGECGAVKPDPALFHHAARTLDLPPHSLCCIGDSYENDILGAQAAGWHTVWLNKEGSLPAPGQPRAEYTVRTIDELSDLLTTGCTIE